MTILEIEILLHYASRATDYREGDFSAPVVRGAIDAFRGDLGLLENETSALPRTYRLTSRGQAFVDHLQAIALPEPVWVVPAPAVAPKPTPLKSVERA